MTTVSRKLNETQSIGRRFRKTVMPTPKCVKVIIPERLEKKSLNGEEPIKSHTPKKEAEN